MTNKKLLEKCSKIKILISDVDGVLTDGGMYYSEKGEELKKFNTKDGMGVELLQKNEIPVILMTKEKSKIVLQRSKKIKIKKTYIGITNKEEKLPEICKKFKVKLDDIAYIGDDINDLEIMNHVFNKKLARIQRFFSFVKDSQNLVMRVCNCVELCFEM